MKIRTTLGFVFVTALVPTIALADDPADPYAPNPAPTAQPTPGAPTPAPAPVPPSTTTTMVITPAQPPPPQPPVVIVNPEPRPATTTVIMRDPETYEVTDAWSAPIFATGALIFAGSYGASVIVAGTSDHVGADRLYVPVVGPWLALNDWGNCPIEQPRCDENTTEKVLLVADGVFQAAGVITMVTGLLSPTTHTVVAPRRTADTLRIRPTRNGFAVIGKF